MITTAVEAVPRVEGAGERLRREYELGLTGYNDLAAPDWAAFLDGRRRFMDGEALAAAVAPAPGGGGTL